MSDVDDRHRSDRSTTWSVTIWGISSLGVLISAVSPRCAEAADTIKEPALTCSALETADFSHVQDAPAQIIDAQFMRVKGNVPANCRVDGYVMPQVGFQIQLPISKWNGKFMEVGCGGTCGVLGTRSGICDGVLTRGYACIVTDMGHKGTPSGVDGLWAYNSLQAKMDFGYRGAHVTALIGKAITHRFYGRAPRRSYFMGCSTGGREGLVEAQRFPWDFDGIIAGDPPIAQTLNNLNLLWDAMEMESSDGKAVLTPQALKRLHAAALAKCDLDDGVKDGIIGDPRSCNFDPVELLREPDMRAPRLIRSQLEVAKKIYSGVTTSKGEPLYFGAMPGSELSWGLLPLVKGSRVDYFRYLTFLPDPGPAWKAADIDFDRDYKRIGMMEPLYTASDPDLRRFEAAGGKLIVYQGWADEFVPPGKTIDYYETVERTMGGERATQDFFRLFMIPGMYHCSGGSGADAADYLSYLDAWVERGRAPDEILTAHVRGSGQALWAASYPYRQFPSKAQMITFTRPVYPFPLRAKYKGVGNPDDAANFESVLSRDSE